MKTTRHLTGASIIFLLTTLGVSAAPCAVGTTTNNMDKTGSKNTSSNVDGGSAAKVTPGAKAESPGTVGAMNNVGASTVSTKDEAKPAEGKVVKPGDTDC